MTGVQTCALPISIFLGAWLGYGGVNSLLLQRDKKVDKETKDEIEG